MRRRGVVKRPARGPARGRRNHSAKARRAPPRRGYVRGMNYRPDLATRITAVAGRAIMALPLPLLRLIGRPPTNSDGDRLDADAAVSLQLLKVVGGGGIEELPIEESRKALEHSAYLAAGPLPDVVMRDETIADVPVRCYGAFESRDAPVIMFLHGGGWVQGSLNSHDAPCAYLADATGVQVVSVDYRLAPEHVFPAGLDDAMAVYRGLLDEGPDRKIVVMGDSAGGNLTAALCLRARDEGLPQPALQALLVPATNLLPQFRLDERTASNLEFAEGFFLTAAEMITFARMYLGPDDDAATNAERAANPWVSPLLADDHGNLAPAYLSVGGFDPLRDEGLAYGEKLREAGVPVAVRRHDGMVHPFINSPGLWRTARRALDDLAGAVRLAVAE